MDKKRYYITLFTVTFLVSFALMFVWWQGDNSLVSGRCAITQIEYTDVSPSDCWIKAINSTYCPLPRNIDCSGEVGGIADLFVGIAKYALN